MEFYLIIMLVLLLIAFAFFGYAYSRNNRVFEFRALVIDAMFRSEYWQELVKEFDRVSYDSMCFSFKPLRLEKWYSEEFCEKINQVQ